MIFVEVVWIFLLCRFVSSVTPWNDRIFPLKDIYLKAGLLKDSDNVILVKSLENPNRYMMMDTGYKNEFEMIDSFFKNNSVGIGYHNISHILISHSHIDHASNAKKLKDLTGAKIIITDYESTFLNQGVNSDYKARGILNKITLFLWLLDVGKSYDACETSPDYDIIIPLDRLKQEDFMLEEFGARILSSPGHTTGSIAVYFEDIEFLFTGDALMQKGKKDELEILMWIESYNQINYTINERFKNLDFQNLICIHCDQTFSREVFDESFKGKTWHD